MLGIGCRTSRFVGASTGCTPVPFCARCISPTTDALHQECDARPRQVLHGAPIREASETGAATARTYRIHARQTTGGSSYCLHSWLAQWIAHRLKGGSAAGPLSFSASADVEVVLDVPVAAEQPKVQDKKAKGRPQPSASAVKTAAHPMLDFKLDVAAVMKAYRAKS